jgi:transcriptional regulator with XRE-family HTH domain
VKLAVGSDRVPAARRFGAELRRALAARGESQRGFARDAGLNRGRMANWLAGTSLPSVETAEAVADRLMWPKLAELARAGRERACDACGRNFIVETPSPQRYCSIECRRFQNAKRVPGRRDLTRSVLERRVNRYSAAIATMCAGCEPSGICQTPECPIQMAGLSPFPIARTA